MLVTFEFCFTVESKILQIKQNINSINKLYLKSVRISKMSAGENFEGKKR